MTDAAMIAVFIAALAVAVAVMCLRRLWDVYRVRRAIRRRLGL